MKIYQLKCPACGGTIEVETNRDSCYCSYCGTKVYVNDETFRAEITKNANYNKIYIDEAKIRKIESDERMHERKLNMECEERKIKKWSSIIINIVIFSILIACVAWFNSIKEASDQQEQELQAIVDEVIQDIKYGDFDEAYINAEKIRYTADWSDDIEDKWDSTRKEIIKQIEKAEKEADKENGSDSWWNPFD